MSESRKFRSPVAVVIWWAWVLFAAGNLIDLAVQGRSHLSVVAAFILLFITGIVYVTALRPKIVADGDGLTLTNPVRVHRVGWSAVTEIDSTDLLRVRCEWPAADGQAGKRVIYSWAVHSSRRKQVAADMRARRRASGGFGMFGAAPVADNAPPPAPVGLDVRNVIAELTERAASARQEAPDAPAVPPASAWQWPAVAAVLIPALALLIAVLA